MQNHHTHTEVCERVCFCTLKVANHVHTMDSVIMIRGQKDQYRLLTSLLELFLLENDINISKWSVMNDRSWQIWHFHHCIHRRHSLTHSTNIFSPVSFYTHRIVKILYSSYGDSNMCKSQMWPLTKKDQVWFGRVWKSRGLPPLVMIAALLWLLDILFYTSLFVRGEKHPNK